MRMLVKFMKNNFHCKKQKYSEFTINVLKIEYAWLGNTETWASIKMADEVYQKLITLSWRVY